MVVSARGEHMPRRVSCLGAPPTLLTRAILAAPPPSTSGPGHGPFKAVARVRIPLASPGRLAQLGERLPYKQEVGGSIPSPPITGRRARARQLRARAGGLLRRR